MENILILGGIGGKRRNFIHDFRVAQISERKYINLTRKSSFINDLTTLTGLPLTSYFLGLQNHCGW